jgi:hypothetical protein
VLFRSRLRSNNRIKVIELQKFDRNDFNRNVIVIEMKFNRNDRNVLIQLNFISIIIEMIEIEFRLFSLIEMK